MQIIINIDCEIKDEYHYDKFVKQVSDDLDSIRDHYASGVYSLEYSFAKFGEFDDDKII